MKIFLRFFRYLKPYKTPLILANIFMILFVIFNLLSVGLLMPFIDLLFNPAIKEVPELKNVSIFDIKDFITYQLALLTQEYTREQLVVYLCVAMLIIFFLKNLTNYLQSFFMAFADNGIIKDIRYDLYSHLHKLSIGFFTEEKKGVLISRIINDIKIIRDSIIQILNSILRDPLLIVVFSIVLFLFNWRLTLFIYLLLPVTGYILSRIGESLKRKSVRSQEKIADITSMLDETLGAVRVVKSFSMEKHEVEKFKKEETKYFNLLIQMTRRQDLAQPITEYIGIISATIILYFIGMEIVGGKSDMTPGSFLVYLGIFFQMMPSLKLFGQMFNSVQQGIAAAERVFSLLDTKPTIVDKPNAVNIKSFEQKITFENVSFKYEKSDLILKDVTIEIDKGQVVAFVGPSGAGKSSLIDLIPRFYDVIEGAVKIDGIDIRDISTSSLRSLMGMVSQETILFNDTIRNNIAYGSFDMPIEKIIESAKAANAHDFISNLPQGYDTLIGDRGVKISGGERQRISIARALLKNPPILILDEATSSLDTESEVLVQQAIENLMKGRTSIVIAHRLSTIQNANKIIVLEEGRVVETGKHEELLIKKGLYHKLYNMQFKL